MRYRIVSLLLALSLLLVSGCGEKKKTVTQENGGTFGVNEASVSAELPVDSGMENTVPAISGTGSFAMPYNANYGWNPFTCKGMENRAVMQLIYEGLFTMNPSFEAEWGLCQDYSVSEDGLRYVLTLRDASFSNGKKLQPLDVTYSMDQAAASELYSSRFSDMTYYVSGDMEVTVELSSANDRLPCLLTFPIIPSGSGGEAPPGTGPFVRSSDAVLTQNGQWWQGAGTLNFQTVTLFPTASAEDTRDHFEIDNVHFVYNNPSASSAATFHCDYELWNSPGTTMQYIGFNFIDGVFQDQAVRKAVTHAINRNSIVETAYHNFADVAVLPVPPASGMYYEDLVQAYNFTSSTSAMEELTSTASFWLPEERIAAIRNHETAAEESESPEEEGVEPEEEANEPPMDEAEPDILEEGTAEEDGAEDEDNDEKKETTYNNIVFIVKAGNLSRVTAAQEVASYLTQAGFTVELKELETEEYQNALFAGDFDIYYGEVVLKPDFDIQDILLPEGTLSYGGIGEDSKLRSLLDAAMENNGNRYDLYKYILEQGYMCSVLFVNNAVFTTRGVFSGLAPAPDNLFYQISNIQVKQN